MNKFASILGLAGVALASLSANAQVFQYNDGDLILDFSKSGSSDLEVDVGNISTFSGLAAGTTVPVTGYSANNQLLATFGGSLDGVAFSVFGTSSQTSGDDYLSFRRVNPAVQNTAPSDFNLTKLAQVSSAVDGIIGFGTSKGILPYSASVGADPVGNTTTAVVIPTSGLAAINSFTTLYNASGGLKSLIPAPGIPNTLSGTFEETPGATAVSDLFEYQGNGSSSKSLFLGDFTLEDNGSLEFSSPSAVPEPKTYGIIAGGGLLLLAFRQQFRRAFSA